ncbi:ABC transporter permease [Streptomyces sp. NPDC090025]|uniref:ABC transporter permease n=1 Tax=Streptomyces sp. NPDC090025 TaxID=3365922 RepID=UPI003837238D
MTGLTGPGGLTRHLLRRLGGAVLVLLALSVLVYALFYLVPGDPARLACGERCNPQQIAQVRSQLGLDQSVFAQYAHFLQGLFTGRDYSTGTGVLHCDAPCLGLSYQNDQQVTQLILERLPATASLALGAMVVWLAVGIGTGLLSALRRGGPTERLLTLLTLAGTGTPVFILGLLLLMAVCAYLQWLPFPSYVPLGEDPEQWAWNMLLPWLTLGLFESAKYARITRGATLETLADDHIRTFRAYGVGERAIVTRHALRGAVPPVIALTAIDLGTMFGGAVLTESLFGIPGLGKTLIDAVRHVDLPVVVGVVLLMGVAVVVANVVADLLYALADRRVALA